MIGKSRSSGDLRLRSFGLVLSRFLFGRLVVSGLIVRWLVAFRLLVVFDLRLFRLLSDLLLQIVDLLLLLFFLLLLVGQGGFGLGESVLGGLGLFDSGLRGLGGLFSGCNSLTFSASAALALLRPSRELRPLPSSRRRPSRQAALRLLGGFGLLRRVLVGAFLATALLRQPSWLHRVPPQPWRWHPWLRQAAFRGRPAWPQLRSASESFRSEQLQRCWPARSLECLGVGQHATVAAAARVVGRASVRWAGIASCASATRVQVSSPNEGSQRGCQGQLVPGHRHSPPICSVSEGCVWGLFDDTASAIPFIMLRTPYQFNRDSLTGKTLSNSETSGPP